MNGKRDVPLEKKQTKLISSMKCHFKQEWKGEIKQCHEKSSYSYYRPLTYQQRATDRRRLRSALAFLYDCNFCKTQPKLF